MYLPIKMNYGVGVTWQQQNRSCSFALNIIVINYTFKNICRTTAKEKSRRSVDTFSCVHTWRLLRNQSRCFFLKREISLMQQIWRLEEVAAMKHKSYHKKPPVIDLLKKSCLVKRDILPTNMNTHIIQYVLISHIIESVLRTQ